VRILHVRASGLWPAGAAFGGLPSRSSLRLGCRAEAAFAWLVEPKLGPPSRLRRFGATAFAWLAEPKLTHRRELA